MEVIFLEKELCQYRLINYYRRQEQIICKYYKRLKTESFFYAKALSITRNFEVDVIAKRCKPLISLW